MRLVEHADPDTLAAALADALGEATDAALAARGRAVLALAGGRTPMPAYARFAAQRREWSRVTVLPTDERWVDAGHPARNSDEMAAALAGAPGVAIRSLAPDTVPATPSAAAADATLADLAAPFDAVLLSMGADTHTASLFPGAAGLAEAMAEDAAADAFVVVPAVLPAEAPFPRITLGRRRLADTRTLLLAISGAAKREALQSALEAGDPLRHPVTALVNAQSHATVHWSP